MGAKSRGERRGEGREQRVESRGVLPNARGEFGAVDGEGLCGAAEIHALNTESVKVSRDVQHRGVESREQRAESREQRSRGQRAEDSRAQIAERSREKVCVGLAW
jgi:hypothetical protein